VAADITVGITVAGIMAAAIMDIIITVARICFSVCWA
jgi:hypothetical protein